MRAEKNLETGIKNLLPFEATQKSDKLISGRVDINVLLNRARKVEERKNFTNLIFLGLSLCLIFITGLILSF